MDDDSVEKGQPSHSSPGSPRDGLIEFGSYSLEQLRELQYSIDKDAFPRNFSNLLAALKRKEEEQATQYSSHKHFYAGLFSRRSGFLGWLVANARRSPVYGAGAIELRSSHILLNGWQRTWLGVPIEAQVCREISNVRNVVQEAHHVQFEIKRRFLPAERVQFRAENPAQAKQIIDALPGAKTERFLKHWAAIRDFNLSLQEVGGTPWVTAVIAAINIAIFLAMAITTKKLGLFTPSELLAWGANFGPLTVNGQWWRTFSALFIHLNLLHLALNMWALWNVGRLSERLYGPGTLSFLYVSTGTIASLSSIAWDPSLSSVGASGAIFGIFGAFFAFLCRQRRQIPSAIVRKHWISTSVFVLFNLVSGATQPGIDNAAHVGGLLSGFLIGLILARPLDAQSRKQFPLKQSIEAGAFILICILGAIWQFRGTGSGLTIPEQYFRTHSAYVSGQAQDLQLWNELAARASNGSISDAEFVQRFEQEILPFWKTQKDLLERENKRLKGPQRDFALLVAEFVNLRVQWASAAIEGGKNHDADRWTEFEKLAKQTSAAEARLERIGIRARMDHRPRALAANPFVIKARHLLTGEHSRCVTTPPSLGPPVADSDDQADGPAIRRNLGCQAQQLFLSGDFEQLESLMNQYALRLEDLPDGSSRLEGVAGGLNNLFDYGNLSPDSIFGYTADWRRRVGGSVFADLVEVMAFNAWAYSARGQGFADTVSKQNWAIFTYRTEMAAAALAEVANRATNNPLWYTLSLEVGLHQSQDKEQLRAIFDRGVKIAPHYEPLYRDMLRILMPRWSGSYEEVDNFINQVYAQTASVRGYERYAALYSAYARMEGDDLDLFHDTPAFWSGMKMGFYGLAKRYPRSDAVLNGFASFACRAGDKAEYNRLTIELKTRFSSSAWSTKYSKDACDKQLGAGGEFHALGALSEVTARVDTLSGVRIGMTQSELLSEKGRPVHQEENYWVYNTIDSRHYGVVTVVFYPSRKDSEKKVLAVAYSGDEASAPAELPYLKGEGVTDILQAYGPQISGNLSLHADTTYTFTNGIFVNTRDEKVYRYGIFRTPLSARAEDERRR